MFAAGLPIRARDGSIVREAAARPIVPGPDGRLVRLVGVSVEGLPEGPYELVIEARDEASGEKVVRREAFALGGPGR